MLFQNNYQNKEKTILVCDDSLFMRTTLKKLISEDQRFIVIGIAQDGFEAIELVQTLKPDMITMDLQMPKMDGAETIRKIMEIHPVPIVVISSVAGPSQDLTLKALANGALDYVLKPGNEWSSYLEESTLQLFKKEILQKLEMCTLAKVRAPQKITTPKVENIFGQNTGLRKGGGDGAAMVLIGCSTGGPQTLVSLLSQFPAQFGSPIIVAQHMHSGFTRSLAARIGRICPLRSKEAEEGEKLKGGVIYILPGEKNMELFSQKGVFFKLAPIFTGQVYKPSIDLLFQSASRVLGENARAVLLTGMGDDGVAGMKAIKKAGGLNFIQNEASCAVFGMPKAALDAGVHHKICQPEDFYLEIQKSI